MSPLKVCIVGAGIGGLCLANGLLNAGVDVQVFERAQAGDSRRQGYQIQLAREGFESLRACLRLAVYEQLVRECGTGQADAPILVDPVTAAIVADLSSFASYPKSQPVARITLLRALLQDPTACRVVHHDKGLAFYEVLERGRQQQVRAHCEDGSYFDCDILVAADGCHSIVNELVGLRNRETLASHVHVQFKTAIDEETLQGLPQVLRQRGRCSFVAHGIRLTAAVYKPRHYDTLFKDEKARSSGDAAHLWMSWSLPPGILPPPGPGEPRHSGALMKQVLVGFLAGLGPDKLNPSFLRLAQAADVETAKYTSGTTTSVRPSLDWREHVRAGRLASFPEAACERVFLLGDAFHPMPATKGAGANCALEDALELLDVLLGLQAQSDDEPLSTAVLQKANNEYERRMIPRAFKRVEASTHAHEALDRSTSSGRLKSNVWLSLMGVEDAVKSALAAVGIRRVPSRVAV